ncbi:hypothetical protein CMUS01_01605 [Colletotrichum musicola]|uniref:Uncharacterized protein n=1 Tax=Colletotrichum musicola TaxID=2175873 RepID=A0A8H6NWX6_9PEZI|nr:hypothetical protein CMUS01_01605 [Colletotrichum musicola]
MEDDETLEQRHRQEDAKKVWPAAIQVAAPASVAAEAQRQSLSLLLRARFRGPAAGDISGFIGPSRQTKLTPVEWAGQKRGSRQRSPPDWHFAAAYRSRSGGMQPNQMRPPTSPLLWMARSGRGLGPLGHLYGLDFSIP